MAADCAPLAHLSLSLALRPPPYSQAPSEALLMWQADVPINRWISIRRHELRTENWAHWELQRIHFHLDSHFHFHWHLVGDLYLSMAMAMAYQNWSNKKPSGSPQMRATKIVKNATKFRRRAKARAKELFKFTANRRLGEWEKEIERECVCEAKRRNVQVYKKSKQWENEPHEVRGRKEGKSKSKKHAFTHVSYK